MLAPKFRTQAPSTGPFISFEQGSMPAQSYPADATFADQMSQVLESSTALPGTSASGPQSSSCPCAKPAPDKSTNSPPGPVPGRKPSPSGNVPAGEGGAHGMPKTSTTEAGSMGEVLAEANGDLKAETVNFDSLCSVLLLAGFGPHLPATIPLLTTMVESAGTSPLPADGGSEMVLAPGVSATPSPLPTPQIDPAAIPANVAPLEERESKAAEKSPLSTLLTSTAEPDSRKPEPEASSTPPVSQPPEEKYNPANPIHGTAAAKKDLQMRKTAENMNLSPERDQSLPSAATLSSAAAVSAVTSFSRKEELSPAPLEALNGLSLQPKAYVAAPELPSTAAPEAPASFERVEQTILNSAIELKRLGRESMSVVLRPDQQTEMHLHLVVSNGHVDVEARISRGDLAHLQSQWSHLQQNLALQGVRLQSIEESRDFAQQGGGGFGGSSHFTRQDSGDSRRREAMLEAELNNVPFDFTTRTNAGRRLWESWA